jgi:hypothetical protein
MIMQDKHKHSKHCQQRGFFERNNYYFGQLLTASGFTDEQAYFNEKRWMMNRFGLGWGVLCGLKIRPHDQDKRKVFIEPGFALDAYGHEIMVCQEETVDFTLAHDNCPPDEPGPAPENSSLYYLCIKYEECGVNPSPIPLDSCEGYKEECAYNRIREGYRFVVSRKNPEYNDAPKSDLECEGDCHRFLQDPSPVISNCCPERPECECIPLARICYNTTTGTTAMDIDMSMPYRKLAFSNAILYEMLLCLQQEGGKGGAGRHDRGQYVPLLAKTIKGLEYRNGKIAKLDESSKPYGFEGIYPFRLTSDGDYIWITDREANQVWRIKRATNEPIKDMELSLDDPTWGIAYDGKNMWITHHDVFGGEDEIKHGRLTRINACTLERWTIDGLPLCETLPDCYRFPESEGAPDITKLMPYAGEIVLHGDDIYVAHDLPKMEPGIEQESAKQKQQAGATYQLYLTRIDPVRGCIVEIISIPESDNREPWTGIKAMASDGEALWITYQASSKDKKGGRAVTRKITKKQDGKSYVEAPHRLSGEDPEHMVFDGTQLWVSHDDGVSIVNIETGKEVETINSRSTHTAMAYGGSRYIWTALPGGKETSINWIDIFSQEFGEWIELEELDSETDASVEISDMQFDGNYIYVACSVKEGQYRKGVIHRLLP